jgi:hypothetical protein
MPTQVAFTAAMRAIGFHHFLMPLHGLNFADLLAPFKTLIRSLTKWPFTEMKEE